MKNKAILLLLTLLSSPAYGMVYSWTDAVGVEHYTNKEYEIPARYRAKVKARYPEPGDAGVYTQNMEPPQPKVEGPLPATAPNRPIPSQAAGKSAPSVATPTRTKTRTSDAVKKMRAHRNRVSHYTEE
ncbi:MAG: hypothetical protein PHF56_10825 [Desulfuromonadaceae bacterium]|nr:hypothetical protein [Desulfuromonadaceae bacterium]